MAVPLWSAMDTKNDEKSQKQTWTLTVHSEGSFFLNKPGLNTPHNFLGNQNKMQTCLRSARKKNILLLNHSTT